MLAFNIARERHFKYAKTQECANVFRGINNVLIAVQRRNSYPTVSITLHAATKKYCKIIINANRAKQL